MDGRDAKREINFVDQESGPQALTSSKTGIGYYQEC